MRDALELVMMHVWAVVHHRWIASAFAVAACVIGWTVVHVLPDQYTVSTRIFLDTQTVLRPILQGLAVDNTARKETAQLMRQTLLTRSNLIDLIKNTQLRSTVSSPPVLEKVVGKLANEIKIEPVVFKDELRRNEDVIDIVYQHPSPPVAKEVVDTLLKMFVERVVNANRRDEIQAQKFLEQQIGDYAVKLERAEDRLKQFKLENVGAMPRESGNYVSRLTAEEVKLAEARLALREAEGKARTIRQQIQGVIDAAKGDAANSAFTVKTPLDVRIEELEKKLDNLLLQFTESHPDVVSTRRVLGELYAKREQRTLEGGTSAFDIDRALKDSKAYQDLKVHLATAEAEAAGLRARVSEYTQRLEKLRSAADSVPKAEAELAKLTRDYDVIKATYESLVKRQQAARISQEAEQAIDETKFKIITPTVVPKVPSGPDRLLLATLVFAGALMGGVIVAWLYAQFKPTFYNKRQVVDVTGLPVLGTVSRWWGPGEIARRTLGTFAFLGGGALLLAGYFYFILTHGLTLEDLEVTLTTTLQDYGVDITPLLQMFKS